MITCTSCGHDVTGKKFCPECGTPVQAEPVTATCPHCSRAVKVGAAFCMHCGSSLTAQVLTSTAASQPVSRACPACYTEVPGNSAFCTNCGQNMQTGQNSAPVATTPTFCRSCGKQNNPQARFCNSCGQPLGTAAQPHTGPYAQPYAQPQTGPYAQPYPQQPSQYQYPSQPYPQQPSPYGQSPYTAQPQYTAGYPPQQPYTQQGPYDPMVGQQPMALRCPICQAMAPIGTPNCLSCRTSLAGVIPTPANLPTQNQQGGFGNMMQGNAGKYAIGALGGAAAVLGGEMLLHEVENNLNGGLGDGYERRHHHREEGLLGGLGELGNDIGLF